MQHQCQQLKTHPGIRCTSVDLFDAGRSLWDIAHTPLFVSYSRIHSCIVGLNKIKYTIFSLVYCMIYFLNILTIHVYSFNIISAIIFLPVIIWHRVPLVLSGHTHLYEPGPTAIHVPPFSQGLVVHGSEKGYISQTSVMLVTWQCYREIVIMYIIRYKWEINYKLK